MQSEFRHTTHHEFRERAKHEPRHSDADEEHFSEPSTMHSLGNLEEHSSPTRDTPKSSKVRQLGHQIKHEAKDQIGSIKAMLSRVFGEKVDTARDNDEKTKQMVKNVNQEILQRPKRSERVIESEGTGTGKVIGGHSSARITEIRDKVARYMPEAKESAHLFISVAKSHLGEIKDNFLSNFNWAESVSPSSDLRPDIKEQLNRINEDIRKLPRRGERVIESSGGMQSSQFENQFQNKKPEEKDLWDLAFHKIEELKEKAHQKGQEKKQEYERTPEQNSGRNEQSGQFYGTQGGPEHQYFHSLHHEHHHLSAQSASFQSTERGRELEQQYLHPHQEHHHHLSAQSASFQSTEHGRELFESVKDGLTDGSVPLTKKIEEVERHWKQEESHGDSGKSFKQGAQELKSNITAKVENIKQSLQPGDQQQQSHKLLQQEKQGLPEQPKEREPLLDKIINSIQAVSDSIHHTIEDLKDSFKVEEAPHNYEPLLDKISHGIENARQRLHPQEKQQQLGDEKDIAAMLIRNLESRQENQEDEKSDEKDIAGMLIRNLKSRGIQLEKSDEEDIANMLTHNLHLRKNRLGDSIHHISDNIHHRVENVRDRLGFGNERALEQMVSQKLSHLKRQGRNLQNRIAQKEEEDDISEDFHRVGTGFYKTIHEYNHERRLIPLKSRNPFEALQADDDEAEEPEDLKEVLPDQPPFDLSISQSLHSLPHRIKESLTRKLDGMRSKLGWEHKHPGEKVHHLVPEEIQGGDEEEEDYEVENFEDENEHAEGRMRRSFKKISSKISALEQQIRSKKDELLEFLNNQEPLEEDEEIVEGAQPISQNIQNIETLKLVAPAEKENSRNELQQIKHRKKKAKTPKSASKAVEKKSQIPSFEGLQPYVKTGFWQTVKEYERELRGPPLISSNPFAGLMGENMPRRRKVSFQEPQQKKKMLFRLSKSAGKEAKRKRFEDFHAIKSGFSESVAHYQREIRGDPLISDNPFEPLNTRSVNLAQPLPHNLVVGGHLDEMTVGVTNKKFDFGIESTQKKPQGSAKKAKKIPGADITNKIVGESQVKTLIQESKSEAHEISSKISGKLHEVKDKIKTAFHRKDKENVAHVA